MEVMNDNNREVKALVGEGRSSCSFQFSTGFPSVFLHVYLVIPCVILGFFSAHSSSRCVIAFQGCRLFFIFAFDRQRTNERMIHANGKKVRQMEENNVRKREKDR